MRPQIHTEHMFSLQEAFLMNADPSFGKFSVNFFFIFAYDQTVTISSRLIFAFAIFALFISTVLMVWKEELFMISPKFQ